MKKSSTVGAAVIVAGSASACGQVFEAFDTNGSAGVIEAFETATDITGAYNYTSSRYAGTSPPRSDLIADAVNIFVVDASDGFGLITVFNNAAGNSGAFDGTVTYTQIEEIRAEDDGGDNSWGVGSSAMAFDLGFSWSGGFTDGFASTFDDAEGSSATFDTASLNDVNAIVWHSADGSTVRSTLVTNGGFGVRVIPTPASAALLGLAGLFARRR